MESNPLKGPFKVVIFDFDGTLLDTDWAYYWAHEKLTGHKLNDELRAKIKGTNSIGYCRIVCEYYGLTITPEELSEKRTNLVDQCWPNAKMMPGAEALVRALKKRGVPMGIATASRRHVYEKKIQAHAEVFGMIDHVVCGNDVSKQKPDPEIYLKALSNFPGVKPSEALVFEDTAPGVVAANRAGMPVVFVPDHDVDVDVALKEDAAIPDLIIKSLENFDVSSVNWCVE